MAAYHATLFEEEARVSGLAEIIRRIGRRGDDVLSRPLPDDMAVALGAEQVAQPLGGTREPKDTEGFQISNNLVVR